VKRMCPLASGSSGKKKRRRSSPMPTLRTTASMPMAVASGCGRRRARTRSGTTTARVAKKPRVTSGGPQPYAWSRMRPLPKELAAMSRMHSTLPRMDQRLNASDAVGRKRRMTIPRASGVRRKSAMSRRIRPVGKTKSAGR
tara:strand:- start:982 stop:1404 length:423 start_codon:yes stop_codon:yes gene_type:complete